MEPVITSGFCSIKVTVQFETNGNDQNEIISHLDRSVVNL